MKNLFLYATKELSQDAFLRWILENYDCENEEVRAAGRALFDSFTNNEFEGRNIKRLSTVAQWKKIDVSVWFEIEEDDKLYVIAIEDKTTSEEHNQLEAYNKALNEKSANCYKIFYKPSKIEEIEIDRVKKSGWRIYDIEKINGLFEDFTDSSSEILRYYSQHISNLAKAWKNVSLPQRHDTIMDCISWQAFFENTLCVPLRKKGYDCSTYIYRNMFAGVTICLQHEKQPYLEIRSEDFFGNDRKELHGKIRVLLLGYEVDNGKWDSFKKRARNFNSQNKLKTLKILNYKRQLAVTEYLHHNNNADEILRILDLALGEYKKIMENCWNG